MRGANRSLGIVLSILLPALFSTVAIGDEIEDIEQLREQIADLEGEYSSLNELMSDSEIKWVRTGFGGYLYVSRDRLIKLVTIQYLLEVDPGQFNKAELARRIRQVLDESNVVEKAVHDRKERIVNSIRSRRVQIELLLAEMRKTAPGTGPSTGDQISGVPLEPPRTWKECEDSNVTICGTWTYDDDSETFDAKWDNGAKATLELKKFEGQEVEITRDDKTGESKGLKATYTGKITPTGITEGKVTWTWGGRSWSGTWHANW